MRLGFGVLAALVVLVVLPAGAPAAVLFREDFSGPRGARANPAVWRAVPCRGFVTATSCVESGARLDGYGNLALEVTRGRAASIATFAYDTGWPPTGGVSAAWEVPFRLTARIKMPTALGVWSAVWMVNVDRSLGQGYWELDAAEPRSSRPTRAACFHHFFQGSEHTSSGNSTLEVGGVGAWHTYTMTVERDRTLYTVDGRTCLQAGGVTGRLGLLLTSLAGEAGTWATAEGPALTGTAWTYIDYVEVSR